MYLKVPLAASIWKTKYFCDRYCQRVSHYVSHHTTFKKFVHFIIIALAAFSVHMISILSVKWYAPCSTQRHKSCRCYFLVDPMSLFPIHLSMSICHPLTSELCFRPIICKNLGSCFYSRLVIAPSVWETDVIWRVGLYLTTYWSLRFSAIQNQIDI